MRRRCLEGRRPWSGRGLGQGQALTRITGTVTATGAVTIGSNVTIVGPLTTSSTAAGTISLGSGTSISGTVNGGSISTSSNITLGSTLTVTGNINLGSNNTITGAVSGGAITTNANVTMKSSLTVTGDINLSSGNDISGNISGANLTANANGTYGGKITMTGTVDMGSNTTVGGAISGNTVSTGSQSALNGNITATGAVTLASGTSMVGNIKAPTVDLNPSNVTVQGNIAVTGTLTIGSGNTVNGGVSGGSLVMNSANVTINGNVNMTGNVSIGSNGTINGDLTARDVTTHASGDYISGNAAVNSIYLDWGATVGKTITCTGAAPGDPLCSCVTKADSNYKPTCGAPAAAAVHHIQIIHSGTALTCQPQTVALIACTNSTCTAPHYTGAVAGTLSPGGLPFAISAGNGIGSGLVQQTTVGSVTLSAASTAAINPSTCLIGSTANCTMGFDNKGLVLSVPDHLSMAANVNLTVQAVQAQNGNQSCVPMLANVQQAPISFGCSYTDPSASADKVGLTDSTGANVKLSCGSSNTVKLNFNNLGIATAPLKYPEVGIVKLDASYTQNATPAFTAIGSTSFTAAPAAIKIDAVRTITTPTLAAGVFARAGEPFTVTIKAVNSDGNTTANFGKESTKENFRVTSSITIPATGAKGTITSPSAPITAGVSSAQWSFSDVGSIKLDVKMDHDSGYYMNNQTLNFNPTATLTLGRFIPDRFITLLPAQVVAPTAPGYSELPDTQIAGVTMLCSAVSGQRKPCVTSTRFVYSRQPFYVVVKAYNMQSALTENYTTGASGLAKTVDLSSWSALGVGTAVPGSGGGMAWTSPGAARLSFTGGIGVVSAGNLPYFDFNFSSTGASNPTLFYVRAQEVAGDGVTSARTTTQNDAIEIPLTAVSGRLYVSSNYGSPTINMPVVLQAQYHAGGGDYLLNPAYVSEQQDINGHFTFDNCKAPLNCAALSLKDGKPTFIGGQARVLVNAPQLTGAADLSLSPVDWGIPYLQPGKGRQTFGIYRSGPVIYIREVHN
jgi:MSHA biogenesis protein MshQ